MLKISYTQIPDNFILGKYTISEYRTQKLKKFKFKDAAEQGTAADLLLQEMLGFMPQIEQIGIGKPKLINSALEFNLSHSGRFAACAVSDTPVGIDIQKRGVFNPSAAKRSFADDELDFLDKSEDKEQAFLEIWCKKESFLKATGTGITVNLNSFSVFKDCGDYKFYSISNEAFYLSVCREKSAVPDSISYIDLP